MKQRLRNSHVMRDILLFLEPINILRVQLVCRRFYLKIVPQLYYDEGIPIKYAKIDNFLSQIPEMPFIVTEECNKDIFTVYVEVLSEIEKLTVLKI